MAFYVFTKIELTGYIISDIIKMLEVFIKTLFYR